MFIDANISREQYNKITKKDVTRFPNYKKIQLDKQECYPERNLIVANDTSAEIKLQPLLDHTVSRILKGQKDVLTNQDLGKEINFCLISKWGFDGSNQAEYKQRFSANSEVTDANIFISSLVPIQRTMEKGANEKIIIWQNKGCSSTRFCRPIKF